MLYSSGLVSKAAAHPPIKAVMMGVIIFGFALEVCIVMSCVHGSIRHVGQRVIAGAFN